VTTNKWQEKVVQVVNTLGIEGMEDRDDLMEVEGRARKHMDSVAYRLDTWGRWVQKGYERDMKYSICKKTEAGKQTRIERSASDVKYAAKLCRHDSRSVSRFNADTSGPDLCRSEGKVIILATVHDTFPKPRGTKTYWLSFDSLDTALQFRKSVALVSPDDLPISMEYMDRDAFDVVDEAGRLLGNTIKMVGTSSPIVRRLWNVKLWIEALPYAGAELIIDKFLYRVNGFLPPILPGPLVELGRSRDHHVAITLGDFGDGSIDRTIDRLHKFALEMGPGKVAIHECASPKESASLSAFRFVAAPAFRTWCVGRGLQGFSVDYALPKCGGTSPPLRDEETRAISPVKRMRYSHFACNVVHEDLAYECGVDIHAAKHALKAVIERKCGGKLPAEHGHGTEYIAPPEAQQRWKRMDPLNVLNPGIGGLSEKYRYEG
jgi:D-lactate dehydrogenase (quinone)